MSALRGRGTGQGHLLVGGRAGIGSHRPGDSPCVSGLGSRGGSSITPTPQPSNLAPAHSQSLPPARGGSWPGCQDRVTLRAASSPPPGSRRPQLRAENTVCGPEAWLREVGEGSRALQGSSPPPSEGLMRAAGLAGRPQGQAQGGDLAAPTHDPFLWDWKEEGGATVRSGEERTDRQPGDAVKL